MNSLQDEVFDYLTNGEGSTTDRKAALRELIASNFFADGDTVESEEKIAQYLSSAHGFCAAGVERFRNALGLAGQIQTLELVVRVDISPDNGMATSVLSNPSPNVVDDFVSFFFDDPIGEKVYFGHPGAANKHEGVSKFHRELSGEYLEYEVQRVTNVTKAAPVKKAPAAKKAPAKKAAAQKAVAKKLAAKKAPARVVPTRRIR